MKNIIYMAFLVFLLCQSCQSDENIPENNTLVTKTSIHRQYSQLDISEKLKILDYHIPDLWEPEIWGEHEVVLDLGFTFPESHSSVHYSQINYTNSGIAEDRLEGRYTSLNMTFADPSQVKPDSLINTKREICGNEAEVYEMIVYPSIEFEIEEETKYISVFFLHDSYYFYFGMGLDMRDIDQHKLYEAQFWEMIDSIECPSED